MAAAVAMVWGMSWVANGFLSSIWEEVSMGILGRLWKDNVFLTFPIMAWMVSGVM